MKLSTFFASLSIFALLPSLGVARTFTDDKGRQIEAEMIGVNGGNVVFSKGGKSAQWSIAKLSTADQQFVNAWGHDPATTPSIVVNVWEREGIGSAGRMTGTSGPDLPKNIPLLKATEEKEKYRYYDVDLSNNSQVDANKVDLKYVIYVIDASNKLVDLADQEAIETIPAGKKATVPTKAATMVSAKTTSATFGVNPLGGSHYRIDHRSIQGAFWRHLGACLFQRREAPRRTQATARRVGADRHSVDRCSGSEIRRNPVAGEL